MTDFNVDEYLKQKYGSGPSKLADIEQAKQNKIAELQAYRDTLAAFPTAIQKSQIEQGRTKNELVKDIGLSALQGFDSIAKLPAMVYDKATSGNFYGPETQAISNTSDEREKRKSPFAQASTKDKAEIVQAAGKKAQEAFGDGPVGIGAQVAAEFGTAFWEAAKDPASIPDFLAQQLPQLTLMGKVGRGAEIAANAAAKAMPKLAATKVGQLAVAEAGTGAAIGAGAVLQGTDTGSDTMATLMKLPNEVWNQNAEFRDLLNTLSFDEAKATIASRLASEATVKSGLASVLSNALPGGSGIEKALVGKQKPGFGTVPKVFLGEAGQEGIEEGSGKYFGNTSVAQIDPNQKPFEGVGAAAGQGAFMGGIMGGGISAANTGLSKVADSFSKPSVKAEDLAASVTLKKAIQSGDVSAYLDPKNVQYAPEKAIQGLLGNSQLETTTPEAKQANLEKASKILSDLQEEKAIAEQAYEMTKPEYLDNLKDQQAEHVANGNTEAAAQWQAQIDDIAGDTTSGPRLEKKIARLEKQISVSQDVLSNFTKEVKTESVDVEAEVQKITAADPVASQAAADNIINLSMATPERLDTKTATALANDETNGLTAPQRAYLRAFTDARVAENTLKKTDQVNQDIVLGSAPDAPGVKYVGLNQYRKNVSTALASNNEAAAEKQLSSLEKFQASHEQKAKAAIKALATFIQDSIPVRLQNENGEWKIKRGAWTSNEARLANGGLNIDGSSYKLVQGIKAEAATISSVAAELRAAYGLKFGQTNSINSQGVSNVQNVQEPSQANQTSDEKIQPEASKETGVTEGSGPVRDNGPAKSEPTGRVDSSPAVKVDTKSIPETQGWKLHLNLKGDTASIEKISAFLKEKGIAHKVGRNGGQSGKDMTLYIGDRDKTNAIAKELNDKFGDVLSPAEGDTLSDDMPISGNVWGRFEIGKHDPRFHQYGIEGVPFLDEDMGQIRYQTDKKKAAQEYKAKADKLLQAKYGSYYSGTTGVSDSAVASTATTVVVEGQNQSTEESSTSPTETVPKSEEVADSAVLEATQQKSPEGTPHELKKFGDFFKQATGNEVTGTQRPLAKVKDFMKAWSEKTVKLSEFLTVESLSNEQKKALKVFEKSYSKWSGIIQANLKFGKDPKFNYQDPIRYLLTGQTVKGKVVPDIDNNVKAALVAAVLSEIDARAGEAQVNDDKAINGILDRDEDTAVEPDARDWLADVGMYQSMLIDSLGSKVNAAIGFKSNGAPRDMLPKLVTSMGAHALKLMEDAGLVVRNPVPSHIIEALRKGEAAVDTGPSDKNHYFLKLSPEGLALAQDLKGSKQVIQKLFGIDSFVKLPNIEPNNTVQQKADTGMGVPSFLKKVLKQKQTQNKWFPNTAVLKSIQGMSEEAIYRMAGAVDFDDNTVHVRNQRSVEAKNNGIIRQVQGLLEWYAEGKAKDGFTFTFNMWNNQRVGIAATIGNPQASKEARWLMAPKEWDTEISLDNTEAFMLRVAEGLGVKTEKALNQTSVDWLEAKMQAPVMQEAVKALQAAQADAELTPEQQDAIEKGVAAGGEKFHSLAALTAYAQYQTAVDTGSGKFTTNLMGEVDGVSNGSILNHLIYGAADKLNDLKAVLQRGGIFSTSSKDSQYNEWYSQGNRDNYEHNAALVNDYLSSIAAPGSDYGKSLSAIWATSKVPVDANNVVTKDGRNMMKTALNPLNYGSGFKAILRNMGGAYVDGIYAQIEKMAKKGNQLDPSELSSFVSNLNFLLKEAGQKTLPVGKDIGFYMTTTLTSKQEQALKDAYVYAVGEPTVEVIKETFGPLLRKTKTLVKATQIGSDLFVRLYEAERTKVLESKGVPVRNGGFIHDITDSEDKAIRAKLAGLVPMMHTAFSKEESALKNGILLTKKQKGNNQETAYRVQVNFGTPTSTGAMSITSGSKADIDVGFGVSAVAADTMSLDSQISHKTQLGRNVLNVHDAIGAGINLLPDTARALNQNTFEGVLNYSPLMAAYESVIRSLRAVVNLDKAGELTDAVKKEIQDYLNTLSESSFDKKPGPAALSSLVFKVFKNAIEADKMKLAFLAEASSVDQYAFNGGKYEVTDADRAKAKAMLAAVPESMSAADKNTVKEFIKALNKKATVTEATTQEEGETSFGQLGKAEVESDPKLVAFFKKNQSTNTQAVIELLSGNNFLKPHERKLLELVRRTLGGSVKVNYITKDSQESVVMEKPNEPSHAWFVFKDGKKEINILGSEFADSGLTAETLLHEMVHASIAQIIDNPTADTKPLVAELNALMGEAKKFVSNLPKEEQAAFDRPLANLQEFVAWGMTNKEFQSKVLTKFDMPTKNSNNKLVTGMQKFIDSLVRMLFKKADESLNTGLTTLVSNVSGLFYAANQQDTGTNLNLSQAIPKKDFSYNTQEIHTALNDGSVSPDFQAHLSNLLTGIVESLHGPFGAFAASLRSTEAKTPADAWLKAKESGVAPFASEALAHLNVSEQEAFAIEQVEVTVLTALEDNASQSKMAYRALYNLYTETLDRLNKDGSDFHEGDWSTATPSEKAAAKAKYDFVFKVSNDTSGRSAYLARFAALGLAHEGFNKILQVPTKTLTKANNETFVQKLQRVFESILNMFSDRVTKTYQGQAADAKLGVLVQQLVDIEAKKRASILQSKQYNFFEPIEKGAKAFTDGARQKLGEAADSQFMRRQKNGYVGALRALVSTVTNNRVDIFLKGTQKFYEENVTAKGSIMVSLLKEMTGHNEKLQAAFRAVKKFEGDRQDMIVGAMKQVRKAFGTKPTKEESKALTSTVLRTGLHNLMGQFNLTQIENLLDNEAAQNAEIQGLIDSLGSMKNEYVHQAKALGYYKATERVKTGVLMFNAHLIARLSGTQYSKKITEAEAQAAEPIIKKLVTLYSLKYTSKKEQSAVKKLMKAENARGVDVGNGVEFLMSLQRNMEQEALERQFNNNPALMMHGFTPEVLDPATEFIVADAVEGATLMDYGYSKGDKVTQDPNDLDQTAKHIYVLKGAGLAPYTSGALLFQTNKAKGTKAHNGYLNMRTDEGIQNQLLQDSLDQRLQEPINTNMGWEPDNEQKNFRAPLFNENGEVVNWRYLANKETKDEMLRRDNRFDKVMGVLAGSVFSKPRVAEQNKKVLETLKEIYKDDYALHAAEYVEVGPKSRDPELRAVWDRLPEQTKQDVLDVWGQNGMWVKPDSFDVVFGYRKRSLAEPIRQKDINRQTVANGGVVQEKDKLSLVADSFVWAVEWALINYARAKLGMNHDDAVKYSKRAAAYVTRGERAWQEIVQETKTIYVIKNVKTMIGNNLSNLSQLWASGVSLNDIRKHFPVALRSATAYANDMSELMELETQLSVGYTQGKDAEIKFKIARLKDAIARNPARELIEAGLMPTIVEDVGADDNLHTYKSMLAQKTERFTDKLNPKVKDAAKFVYMTRDGKLYKALHSATQMGDFVARYTMYQHLINKPDGKLTKEQIIQEVSEAFVNYDIPMHRNIQYMDDMGLFMFTKYFLRMQKVLLKMGRENPARVVALGMTDSYFNLSSIVLDSSALHHIGNNPFNIGAFGYPYALDDLATVKATMSLLK